MSRVGRALDPTTRYPCRVSRGPLLELFDASLVGRATEAALETGPAGGPVETLTFGEIGARSRRMARVLTSRGLRRGDRLAVQLANRAEFLDLFLACLNLGVIFVPINVLTVRARSATSSATRSRWPS